MIEMKIVTIIFWYKNGFRKASSYNNPYKSSGENKAKRYFRHNK